MYIWQQMTPMGTGKLTHSRRSSGNLPEATEDTNQRQDVQNVLRGRSAKHTISTPRGQVLVASRPGHNALGVCQTTATDVSILRLLLQTMLTKRSTTWRRL